VGQAGRPGAALRGACPGEMVLDENRKFRTVRLINAAAKKDVLSAYSLAQLTLEYGSTAYLETNMGKSDRDAIFRQPLDHVSEYGVVDVVIPFQIYKFQMTEIKRRGGPYLKLPMLVEKQLSSMIKSFVEMELTGLPTDRYYLTKEVSSGGAFQEAREKARKEIYAMESVKKANRILVDKYHGADLFDRAPEDNWVFDIDTVEHQQLLFFDVLKLQPTAYGKSGVPSVNKAFKEKHAPFGDDGKLLEEIAVPEVAEFRLYAELKHLYSSFIKGFHEKLYSDDDMRFDGRLRPEFIFLTIVTGRSGARKPSLQQVPSRSKLAKPINRQFVSPEGTIFLKSDYIAQEVKNWMLVSNEGVLARIFIQTMVKRREFRLADVIDDPKMWDNVFKELDLHRQSAQHFFGIPAIDVTKELRTRVKTLVFGTVYGMSPYRLSITLSISVEDAEELQRTLFDKYPDGSRYIAEMHEQAREHLYITSAIGRIRHLWGYLHTDFGVYGAMDRRAVNSAIQSLASDEGFEGCVQTQRLRWELFHSQDIPLRFSIANMVHDSSFSMTELHTAPIAAYLTEHGFTTMVHKAYKEYYGFNFIVGLELDFELGGTLGDMYAWNYRPETLDTAFEKTVKWQRDVMNYKVPDSTFDKFYTNADIIRELRESELRSQPENGVGMHMALTKKIARELIV
jgi:DNA polymerase I-like protein with 3'-5' exonuclease and polymerase domains